MRFISTPAASGSQPEVPATVIGGPVTLWRNGALRSPAAPEATALLVRDGVIEWLGADRDAPSADRIVDLDGALVTPAFVDAHVHGTDTGLTLRGLDLSGVRSAGELLDAVAAHAGTLPVAAVLTGHGFDESTWGVQAPPTAGELARAAGGRSVYLSQASVHSALVSPDLLALARGVPGFDESGWVRRQAHHVVRGQAFGRITPEQVRDAQRATLAAAAALGVAAVHECGGPGTSSETDFQGMLALGGVAGSDGPAPEVYGYWGELGGAARARELGAVAAGGDLYADGALGSRTAHVREEYLDGELGCGHGYVTAEQVTAHLVECHREGMQGGFHAIGDAALETVVAGFAAAARVLGRGKLDLGLELLRDARHRVEHAELVDRALIAGFVEFGIVASMQPAFDRLWGGEEQMYAQRLGVARSLASNPMGQMHATGVRLAFGSDSPVTPLDPWGSVRAAMWHFNPVQRMSAGAAFAAHSRGGWRALPGDVRWVPAQSGWRDRWAREGVLEPGAPATFAVWDTPAGRAGTLPVLEPGAPLPVCRRTVVRGVTVFDADGVAAW